jgi:hypothetical protein
VAKFGSVDGDRLTCSFCGKAQTQVQKLIAGPGVYICDECIALCNEILLDEGHVSMLDSSAEAVSLPRHELTRVVRTLDQAVGAIGPTNAGVADDAARLAARLHRRLQAPPGPAGPADEPEPPDGADGGGAP